MSKEKNTGIGFFERYLTIWVVICMVVGVLAGKFIPKFSNITIFEKLSLIRRIVQKFEIFYEYLIS